MSNDPSPRPPGFGKRGRVEIARREPEPAKPAPASGLPVGDGMKWAAGGLAALFLLGLVGGTGGGSLLGGLLGGLLGHQLAKQAGGQAARTATSMPSAATVERGGFGATGHSSGAHVGG